MMNVCMQLCEVLETSKLPPEGAIACVMETFVDACHTAQFNKSTLKKCLQGYYEMYQEYFPH